jgi:transposase
VPCHQLSQPASEYGTVINERYFLSLYSQGARAVLRYIEQLEKRITDAEARITRSQQTRIDRLSHELARTRATLDRKSKQLVEQQQLNHQLMLRLRELEREVERSTPAMRDSHNSSLPPSSDPPWKKVPRTQSLRGKSGRRVGGHPGHRGSTLRQSAHPDHVITHAATSCLGCGCMLRDADAVRSDRRQVFDLPEVRRSVTEHRAVTRRCPQCGAEAQAAFPAGVCAPVQYGPRVLARAAYFRLYQLLPAARTAEALRDLFGCPLSPATAVGAGRAQLGEEAQGEYLRRYDSLLRKADKLNPYPPKVEDESDTAKKKRPSLSPQRRLVNRLSRRRDEVLRFMTDLAVPFTNNGAERDLRMVKVQQKVSGCFPTEDGARDFCRVRSYLSTAREQGRPLLLALERALAGKPLQLLTAPA